jgi:hypothetical protein
MPARPTIPDGVPPDGFTGRRGTESPGRAARVKGGASDGMRTAAPDPSPDSPASMLEKREDPHRNAPLLTDGRLKVQALAWSPVDEDRMAVINTRIVHEGDKVDDFVVLAIRADDVVVMEKGVVYRAVFGRP